MNRRRAFAVVLALVATVLPGYAQVTSTPIPTWRVTTHFEPVWLRWTSARVLLVGDRAQVVGLDEQTGRELWRRDGFHDPVIRFAGDGSMVRVVDGPQNARRVRWILTGSGLDATDSVSIRRAEVEIVDIDRARFRDTDSTGVRWRDGHVLRERRDSETVLWDSGRLESRSRMPCAAAGDATPVARESKDPRPLLPPAPLLKSQDGRVWFVNTGNAVFALTADEGRPVWPDPRELCGRPVEIIETARGVLVRTMPEARGDDELVLLAADTGQPIWRYPGSGVGTMVTNDLELGNVLVDGDAAYVLAGRQLVRLELADGRARALGKAWIAEYDRHVRLERVGAHFVLSAGQEMEWLDDRGRSAGRIDVEPVDGQREIFVGRRLVPHTYPDSVLFMLASVDPSDVLQGPLLVGVSKSTGKIVRRIPASPRPLCEFHPEGPVFVADRRTVSAYVP